MLAGTLRYPLTRFAAFDALAAVLSASYVVMLGYWVGDVLVGNPLTAVLAGLAISALLAAAAEGLRVARQRRAPAGRGDESGRVSQRSKNGAAR